MHRFLCFLVYFYLSLCIIEDQICCQTIAVVTSRYFSAGFTKQSSVTSVSLSRYLFSISRFISFAICSYACIGNGRLSCCVTCAFSSRFILTDGSFNSLRCRRDLGICSSFGLFSIHFAQLNLAYLSPLLSLSIFLLRRCIQSSPFNGYVVALVNGRCNCNESVFVLTVAFV